MVRRLQPSGQRKGGREEHRKSSGLDLEVLVSPDTEQRLFQECSENHWEFLSRKRPWIRLLLGKAHHVRHVGKGCAGIGAVVARRASEEWL